MFIIRKFYDENSNSGNLGLPSEATDPNALFNNKTEEPKVEVQEENNEPVKTTEEPKTEEQPTQEEPKELTNEEKYDIATKGFVDFLKEYNPEAAQKISQQQSKGQAGYQDALAYAKINDPNAVNDWRSMGGVGYAMNQHQNRVEQPQEDNQLDNEYIDLSDPKTAAKFFNNLLDQHDKKKTEEYNRYQQEQMMRQVQSEHEQGQHDITVISGELSKRFGDELGQSIVNEAFQKINSYGINTHVPGGAENYVSAFKDQLLVAINRVQSEQKQKQIDVNKEAEIAKNVKQGLLQSQPRTSAPETAEPTKQEAHLNMLRSLKEQNVSEALKQM